MSEVVPPSKLKGRRRPPPPKTKSASAKEDGEKVKLPWWERIPKSNKRDEVTKKFFSTVNGSGGHYNASTFVSKSTCKKLIAHISKDPRFIGFGKKSLSANALNVCTKVLEFYILNINELIHRQCFKDKRESRITLPELVNAAYAFHVIGGHRTYDRDLLEKINPYIKQCWETYYKNQRNKRKNPMNKDVLAKKEIDYGVSSNDLRKDIVEIYGTKQGGERVDLTKFSRTKISRQGKGMSEDIKAERKERMKALDSQVEKAKEERKAAEAARKLKEKEEGKKDKEGGKSGSKKSSKSDSKKDSKKSSSKSSSKSASKKSDKSDKEDKPDKVKKSKSGKKDAKKSSSKKSKKDAKKKSKKDDDEDMKDKDADNSDDKDKDDKDDKDDDDSGKDDKDDDKDGSDAGSGSDKDDDGSDKDEDGGDGSDNAAKKA